MDELTSSGGWTCTNCGEFVPNGMAHICPTKIGPTDQFQIIYNPADSETLRLLRQIADDVREIKKLMVRRI